MTVELMQSIDPYRRGHAVGMTGGSSEIEFSDVLDAINPLQHIPGIGWLYREITGDTIKPPAAIAGGAIFGGPIGFAAAVLSAAFESLSGETPEEFVTRTAVPDLARRADSAYARTAALAGDENRR